MKQQTPKLTPEDLQRMLYEDGENWKPSIPTNHPALLSRPLYISAPRKATGRAGVYAIQNVVTGAIYVGQTINIDKRWKSHRITLNAGTHKNTRLQKGWTKRGEQAFKFVVLEPLDYTGLSINQIYRRLLMAERRWLARYAETGVKLYNNSQAAIA